MSAIVMKMNMSEKPASAGAAAREPAIQATKSPPAAEPKIAAVDKTFDWKPLLATAIKQVLAMALGLAILIGIWSVVADRTENFPGPAVTWEAAVDLLSDPFYSNGPNDMGIGWNVLYSLERVGIGFGLAALIGIPAGFLIGRFTPVSMVANPVISLLRPVSPLAWLPIGLFVFKAADPSAIWVIFICSIWPMVLNTAQGVRSVPKDYLNVARVLKLPEWKVATKILFPAVLPHILTGVRLAVGTAWLVIVAAEMLTGGIGIGFWVWDEWNNLKIESIIIAIFIIGIVGLLLEQGILLLAGKFVYDKE